MTQGQLRRWHQGDWGLKGSGRGVCVSHDPRCLAWVTRQAVDSREDGGDGLFEGKLIDSGLGGCSGPVGHPRGGIQLDIWDFAQKKCLVAWGGVLWRFRVHSIRDGTERRLEGGSSWVMSTSPLCTPLLPQQLTEQRGPRLGPDLCRGLGTPASGMRAWDHALHCSQKGEPLGLEGWGVPGKGPCAAST